MDSSPIPTRRNGATSPKSSKSTPTTTQHTARKSWPLLPTPLETVILAVFPSTLLLGSFFSLLNPTSRASPYIPLAQSHSPELAPSYFAQKRNLFNIFFVKIGWFWTSLAFFIFLALHPSTGPRPSASAPIVLTPRRLQGLLRWALVTAWWGAVTQWFFGPALIDRGFRLTGGVCARMERGGVAGMNVAEEVLTSTACKLVGGQWRGGHDISGHVVLLTLGCAFLGLEILPVVMRYTGLGEERVVRGRDGSVKRAGRPGGGLDWEGQDGKNGVGIPLAVAGLSWWMLLMTAAYFHTWVEKVRAYFRPFTRNRLSKT